MQGIKEGGRIAANLRIAVANPVQIIEILGLSQRLRFRHALRDGVPRNDGLDGGEGVGPALLGLQQGMADFPVQPHLFVDRLARLLKLLFMVTFGTVEQAADDAIMQIDDFVNDHCLGFEHHRNQCGVAPCFF